MFVVVYLKDAKKNIIVPEEWIFDLDEQKLKNHGANSNQNYLVFWSYYGIYGDDDIPNAAYEPNFFLDKMVEYPPPHGVAECCYIGRIKHFYPKLYSKIIVIMVYLMLFKYYWFLFSILFLKRII